MKNNDTGGFELVLGNRQLLSGFFIVALLFGVAFAMGYIVGRNSSPTSRTQTAGNTVITPADARPQPAEAAAPPAQQPDNPPAVATASTDAATQQPAATDQPSTQPAQELGEQATATPASTAAQAPADQDAGHYWQVMAVSAPEAGVVLKTLKDKGFPAFLQPGPKNLVRVLVGPYNDTAALGRAKSDLENAGFQPIRK
ncbi:MAG TPA: hypothetical protein VG675_17120 [Bryobacteraceae bacterium]|nr:hypothetical protein [Bryobacteraceae bacterium]